MRRLLALAVVVPAALLAAPEPADAGTLKVFSCKLPDGRPAPTDGWSANQRLARFSSVADSCAGGGGLHAFVNGDVDQPNDAHVGWQYAIPAGLELRGIRVWRHASVTAAAEQNATPVTFMSWPSPNYSPDGRDTCVAGDGCRQRGTTGSAPAAADLVAFDGFDAGTRTVYAWAGCGGSWTCVDRNSTEPMAQFTIKAFEARLRDDAAPVLTRIDGPLVRDRLHRGIESLGLSASDAGSGVYRAIVELRREGSDGWDPVLTQIVDANGGDCADADLTTADPYEFTRRVPCKGQVGGDLALDTRTIPNGAHELRVAIEDASGNRSPVSGPLAFPVSNGAAGDGGGGGVPGVPVNGAGASNGVRVTVSKAAIRRARHLRFGQRFRLIATVRNERGEPVQGATVDVLQRTKLPGARYRTARRPVVTGRRGQVRWRVPAGTSRRLRLAYKANVLNGSYQATTDVPLVVDAATTIGRDRRSYRNGQTIRFRGTVRSKPIPRGGVLVDLQARRRGAGWITFATKRTTRRGRWRIPYRLRSTTRPTRYRFRARIRQDSGYPYAASSTKSMSVLVRP